MTGQIMTNLKTVEEVADDYFGIKTSFVLERKGFEQTLTQDHQAHRDELVRRLEEMKPKGTVVHDWSYEYAKDQALTIVKEIYKVKN